jgi:hypothetical protein
MKEGTKWAIYFWVAGSIALSVNLAVDWSAMTSLLAWIGWSWVCILTPAFCLVAGFLTFGREITR